MPAPQAGVLVEKELRLVYLDISLANLSKYKKKWISREINCTVVRRT